MSSNYRKADDEKGKGYNYVQLPVSKPRVNQRIMPMHSTRRRIQATILILDGLTMRRVKGTFSVVSNF